MLTGDPRAVEPKGLNNQKKNLSQARTVYIIRKIKVYSVAALFRLMVEFLVRDSACGIILDGACRSIGMKQSEWRRKIIGGFLLLSTNAAYMQMTCEDND